MKQYPFLDLALTNAPYMAELKAAAIQVIEGGRYLHGEQTEQLELEIAALCQVKHCVAVSNGLDALRLILRAYKEMGLLHEGDEVIVYGEGNTVSEMAAAAGLISYELMTRISQRVPRVYVQE